MKAVTVSKATVDYSGIENLRNLLMRLVENNAHELPEEAIQGKSEIKDYFLNTPFDK
jgi:hypothetical protein